MARQKIRYPDRTCIKCGNAIEECECADQEKVGTVEQEGHRCPYCGSKEPPEMEPYPYGDWPRCPDCGGC